MGDVNLPFGLCGDEYVHISRVKRGLACGCICPGCRKELVARKGEIAAHHFAHRAELGCNYQPETSLHDYAKRLLVRQKNITLPASSVTVIDQSFGRIFHDGFPAEVVEVRDAHLERKFEDVTPDVQVEAVSSLYFIEVAVTHFVDREKRKKLRRMGIPTIEIDLSTVPLDSSLEVIDAAVLNEMSRWKWAFHPREDEIRHQLELRRKKRQEEIEASYHAREYDHYRSDDNFEEDEDGDGWRLLRVADEYSDADVESIDAGLRNAPPSKRLEIYKLLDEADKVAYHCHLIRRGPRYLPVFFNRHEPEGPPFMCTSVVWRTGVYWRFVVKNREPFKFGDVVGWCRERYGVFSFGHEMPESTQDESSQWSMTLQEESVYDFLRDLEFEKYLESDGFIPKGREFTPTGKPLGKR